MIARWHLLTGEYAPVQGGIAQYVAVMAEALAARGADVHVWTANGGGRDRSTRVTVHRLPDHFGPRSRTELAEIVRVAPGRVLLHYTPNALGSRGANLAFCRWFAARGRNGWDARVLFHEPFMYFGPQSLARNTLALVHRLMAASLLRTNHEVYLSTPSWQPVLEPYSTGQHRWTWVPISAGPQLVITNDAVAVHATVASSARYRIGTFGTYAQETAGVLREAIVGVLRGCTDANVICLGRNSREFVSSLVDRSRVNATGELSDEDLSAAIASCDLMLQPFPEGVTCRRTSLLRSLAQGAAVVTTRGRYTEPLWEASSAVALVDVGEPAALAHLTSSLLGDEGRRAQLGAFARRLYESSFSPAAVTAALDPTDREPSLLVGTHTFAATGRGAVRQHAALQSMTALRRARVVSLEHAGSEMMPRVSEVEYAPVLREDSVQLSGRSGSRKAITSEVFAELAERTLAAGGRYFLFANGDVEILQPVVDRVLQGDRLAYLFWRTDVDPDGSNAALIAEGIDVFAVDARWYKANSHRFRPYIIGERTWDNVYAAILGAEAHAAFIVEPGWVRHERHERRWEDSPFQFYLQYLSALDHQHFAQWCAFWDRARDAVRAGADVDGIAAQVFRRTSGPADRAIQLARNVKAVIRYHTVAPLRSRAARH